MFIKRKFGSFLTGFFFLLSSIVCFYSCICSHLKVSTSHCPCRRRVVCHESSSHSWGRDHSPRKQTNTKNLNFNAERRLWSFRKTNNCACFSILWLFKSVHTSGVSPKRGIESGVKDSGPQITVLCPTLSSIGKRLQCVGATYWTMYLIQKVLKWLLVDCF